MKNANEKNPQTKTPNSRLKDPLLDCLKLLEMQFPQILLDYSDIDSGVLLALSATQKSTLLATPPVCWARNTRWERLELLCFPPSSLAYNCQHTSIK